MSDNKKVVFPELIIVEGRICGECVIDIGDCRSAMKELTGIDCEDGVVFQKPENWQTCTRENTKVGNTIKAGKNNEYKLEHFLEYKTESRGDIIVNSAHRSYVAKLSEHEINLNR